MKLSAALLSLLALCLPAFGQAPGPDLTLDGREAISNTHIWKVQESTDKMSDTKFVDLLLYSPETYKSDDGSAGEGLISVSCSGPSSFAALNTLLVHVPATIGTAEGEQPRIRVRLDSAPAFDLTWNRKSGHALEVFGLARSMSGHRKLLIDVPLLSGGSEVLAFDISLLPTALRANNCTH